LQEVLLEYRDVFRPTTSIVRGPDFSIKLRDGADIPRPNRVAFRKSPLENKVEEIEMKKLLERGIIEPSISPCGTSKVLVPKKALPDGTPGGLRVTADMRAVNAVTVSDAFRTEDIGAVMEWLARKRCYSVADLKYGYWNVRLAEEERGWLPVGSTSRKLKKAEPCFTTTVKENLAIAFRLQKFGPYLYEENVVAVAKMAAAQEEARGDGAALLKNEERLRDEDGLICQVFGKNDVQMLVTMKLVRSRRDKSCGNCSAARTNVVLRIIMSTTTVV
jgi:RNase H-like domain found in reverse transcriptase